MNIKDILAEINGATADKAIAKLREKSVNPIAWKSDGDRRQLYKEYDPSEHDIMNPGVYPDINGSDGIQKVTRVPLAFQRLATNRMTELVTGIPVKRIYHPTNDRQQEVAAYLENIFQRVRIDAVNVERCRMLFASCEVMTLWYAVEGDHNTYGFPAKVKMRCRSFSPMFGEQLFPLFDEYGDMVAMSVQYQRRIGNTLVTYFDAYTADRHIKFSNDNKEWNVLQDERITTGKIPAVYMWRPEPIWGHTSPLVSEMEWALSRNGNYLRQNSRPILTIYADEALTFGNEEEDKNRARSFKDIYQLPADAKMEYCTWNGATDALKFQVDEMRNWFFTLLQLPDWSYEKMSQTAMSGESRKQLFIDAQLKVKDESGRLLEFFDREVNVVKSFLAAMLPEYTDDINNLAVETQITPFSISDEKDTIETLLAANGNEPLISQREAIERLGWSDDVTETLRLIGEQSVNDIFEPTR